MNHSAYQEHLLSTFDGGTWLTAKHGQNFLHLVWDKPRSVPSHDLASNLRGFLRSGPYSAVEYGNPACPATPKHREMVPASDSSFSVPASGVNSFTPDPSTALDRLVAVSGVSHGLHLYGEDSRTIQDRLSSGTRTLVEVRS